MGNQAITAAVGKDRFTDVQGHYGVLPVPAAGPASKPFRCSAAPRLEDRLVSLGLEDCLAEVLGAEGSLVDSVCFVPHPLVWKDYFSNDIKRHWNNFAEAFVISMAAATGLSGDLLDSRLKGRKTVMLDLCKPGFGGCSTASEEQLKEWGRMGGPSSVAAHCRKLGLNPLLKEHRSAAMSYLSQMAVDERRRLGDFSGQSRGGKASSSNSKAAVAAAFKSLAATGFSFTPLIRHIVSTYIIAAIKDCSGDDKHTYAEILIVEYAGKVKSFLDDLANPAIQDTTYWKINSTGSGQSDDFDLESNGTSKLSSIVLSSD